MRRLLIVISFIICLPLVGFRQQEAEAVSDIDLVIAMDLSSSTNGILETFRDNYWRIVSDFVYYKPKPRVRIGFIAFGRPSYGKDNNYVSIVSDLTYDFDLVAKELHEIKSVVAKGDCYIADVIYNAVRSIKWSKDETTLKLLYVIGNGSPYNGVADVPTVCEMARKKGIVINPVYYKSYPIEAEEKKWMSFAESCSNDLSVAYPRQPIVILKKEYDTKVLFLANKTLNDTYVYYGNYGQARQQVQLALDQKAAEAGENELEARIVSKASGLYQQKNASWDLVDLSSITTVDYPSIDKLMLAENLKTYDNLKLETYIIGKKKERIDAVSLIDMISHNRVDYLKSLKKEIEEKIKVDNSLPSVIRERNLLFAKEWQYARLY